MTHFKVLSQHFPGEMKTMQNLNLGQELKHQPGMLITQTITFVQYW